MPPAVKTISEASAPIKAPTGPAGLVQRGFGLLTEMVDAGGVAPDVAHRLGHPVGDQRVERGRRVMVQIDTHGVKC